MVPNWSYSPGEPAIPEAVEARIDEAHHRRARLQRRSRGQPISQDILALDHSHRLLSKEGRGALDVTAPAVRGKPWTSPVYQGERRPDYIVKADEDSFIVLGELERRLRVAPRRLAYWGCE